MGGPSAQNLRCVIRSANCHISTLPVTEGCLKKHRQANHVVGMGHIHTHAPWQTDTCAGHHENLRTQLNMTPESRRKNKQIMANTEGNIEDKSQGSERDVIISSPPWQPIDRETDEREERKQQRQGCCPRSKKSTGIVFTSCDLFVNMGPTTVKSPLLPVYAAL